MIGNEKTPTIQSIQVLLVEEPPGELRLIRDLLRSCSRILPLKVRRGGYSESENILLENQIDVMLLDLGEDSAKGLEIVRRLRAVSPSTAMVVLTARLDEELGRAALREGAQDYNVKDELSSRLLSRAITYAIERKKIEEELIRTRKQSARALEIKSRFLANMSHEIRTPLNAIVGMADLLLETPLTGEQEKFVRIFRKSSRSLLSIVNDILDISKLEGGRVELERRKFNLPETIERVLDMMKPSAADKELNLIADVNDVPDELVGDSHRLYQVLMNLVSNAIKFTNSGEVRLKARVLDPEQPYRLTFTVADTGIGIPAEKQTEIFNSFSQGDLTITRSYGGTGLGLTICKQLVELMNGKIWIDSETEIGTCIHFTAHFDKPALTRMMEESNRAAAQAVLESSQAANTTPASTPRVLLVEDSPDNRFLIQAFTRRLPHELEVAENGRIAVEKFAAARYDLVLMDMQMPIMDGYSATRKIRQWERENERPPTPIVALTAYALPEEVRKSLGAGCDAHLTKPIVKKTLLETIRTYCPW